MPAVARLTGPSRDNVIALIGQLAHAGTNDPDTGARLGLTAAEVAALREENGIEAGEQRWRGREGGTCAQVPADLDLFGRTFDWATVPAHLWSAITLKGPWDFPIVAPHVGDDAEWWTYPAPPDPGRLPPAKTCENRTWNTYVRGPLLIHAGKGWDRAGERDPRVIRMWNAVTPGLVFRREAWTWAGHVTGVARLVDCHLSTPGCCPPWGAYGVGSDVVHHLILDDVRALPTPVPATGRQQLWRPDAELVETVRAMLPPGGGGPR